MAPRFRSVNDDSSDDDFEAFFAARRALRAASEDEGDVETNAPRTRLPRHLEGDGMDAWRVDWRRSAFLQYLRRPLSEVQQEEHLRLFGVTQDVFISVLASLRIDAPHWARDGGPEDLLRWCRDNGAPFGADELADAQAVAAAKAWLRNKGCPFNEDLVDAINENIGDSRPRPPPIPLANKVLAALHWLTSGSSVQAVAPASGIGRSTLDAFTRKFAQWLAHGPLGMDAIRTPTPVEVQAMLGAFERAGFPGCVAIADGVHVCWDRAPAPTQHIYIGKEGYPTVVFNVTVDITGRVLHVHGPHPGSRTDTTIARTDQLFDDVGASRPPFNVDFETIDEDGSTVVHRGPWIMVDNGYSRVPHLICPFKYSAEAERMAWSKRLESLRKVVERTFGQLKKRFAALRNASHADDEQRIGERFRAACVLFNLQGEHDGKFELDERRWTSAPLELDDARVRDALDGDDDEGFEPDVAVAAFDDRVEALIRHYTWLRSAGVGMVEWFGPVVS